MKHNMVSRSNMHEVLPQGPTRSGDGAVFSAAPRRARAAVSARTRVQAHRKADEPTRPIRLSSKHQPDAGPRASATHTSTHRYRPAGAARSTNPASRRHPPTEGATILLHPCDSRLPITPPHGPAPAR